jgi:hypothetical protein
MAYRVTVDCLMTWFAATPQSTLAVPRLRSASFTHMSYEPALATSVSHQMGHGGPFDDGLYHPNGSVDIRFENGVYKADLRLELFGATRSAEVVVPSDTQVPFLLQVDQGTLGFENVGTAAVFQGVFAAGQNDSLALSFVKLVGRLSRLATK